MNRFMDFRTYSITSLFFIVVPVVVYLVLECVFGVKQFPQEPPFASTRIPYIGHSNGFMRHKMKYYLKLSAKNKLPIYTVSIMGGKIYVVTHPDLVVLVLRNHRVISFANLASAVVSRVSLSSKKATAILLENVNGDQGDRGYSMETYKGMHAALLPGASLDSINRSIIPDIAGAVGRLDPSKNITRIKLYEWVRHTITMATSNAVYGPKNPFKDPHTYTAFWDFENNFTSLLLNILLSLVNPSGHRGRAQVREAFQAYFRQGDQAWGSDLVQARYNVAVHNDVPLEDIASLETTMPIGVLANTAPAAFWVVCYVFSRPDLVEDLRAELSQIVLTQKDEDGSSKHFLNLANIRQSCPLLLSTWHEVLRLVGCGTSARFVRKDVLLQDRYLLKKGNVIQMPSQVVHADPLLWSSTSPVEEFDPRRFIGMKPQPGAFRPFGGGTTLCPGRHVSAMEIQAMISMLVMRYDIVSATGKWEKPAFYLTSFASAIVSPNSDPVIDVIPRKGWENASWTFNVPESMIQTTTVAKSF